MPRNLWTARVLCLAAAAAAATCGEPCCHANPSPRFKQFGSRNPGRLQVMTCGRFCGRDASLTNEIVHGSWRSLHDCWHRRKRGAAIRVCRGHYSVPYRPQVLSARFGLSSSPGGPCCSCPSQLAAAAALPRLSQICVLGHTVERFAICSADVRGRGPTTCTCV